MLVEGRPVAGTLHPSRDVDLGTEVQRLLGKLVGGGFAGVGKPSARIAKANNEAVSKDQQPSLGCHIHGLADRQEPGLTLHFIKKRSSARFDAWTEQGRHGCPPPPPISSIQHKCTLTERSLSDRDPCTLPGFLQRIPHQQLSTYAHGVCLLQGESAPDMSGCGAGEAVFSNEEVL